MNERYAKATMVALWPNSQQIKKKKLTLTSEWSPVEGNSDKYAIKDKYLRLYTIMSDVKNNNHIIIKKSH